MQPGSKKPFTSLGWLLLPIDSAFIASAIFISALFASLLFSGPLLAGDVDRYTYQAGHPSLQVWLLPDVPPAPKGNESTPARQTLGKKLFFDPSFSADGSISCASCHDPRLGWSDGKPTSIGMHGAELPRAAPSLVNSGFLTHFMWDGRSRSLEGQAVLPMTADNEMSIDLDRLFATLNASDEYLRLFAEAYPDEPIDLATFTKALAVFERSIISNDSPFDRWVRGNAEAMTDQQVDGFKLFVGKGNCEACHMAPNFTDNGFHNIGLASSAAKDADLGRYRQVPITILRHAFKTPTLRDVTLNPPYFHDGSAKTLMDVVEHYNIGGVVRDPIDPNMRPLGLTAAEKDAIVAFMQALTTPPKAVETTQ